MTGSRLLTLSLALASASRLSGQASSGVVTGTAKIEESGAPIPFALVRLVPTDTQSIAGRQQITNAQGRFQFISVAVGTYRLQLLRIGYRPVLSPIIDVRTGETIDQQLIGSMVGLPLPRVVVYAEGTCLTADRAAGDPYVATLWEDVRKGVEVRRAFDQRYRYKRALSQSSELVVPSRTPTHRQRTDTIVSEPDSVLVREEHARARRSAEGFGRGNTLGLPDEKEVLDDTFLRTHCIVPAAIEADGATGIQFRQSSKPNDGFGLQGTIWVDAATRLMRRLELEYLNGDERFGQVIVAYADVAVAGTTLRLPTTGSFSTRLLQAPRGTTATGTIAFSYWGFEEIRPK
jgi:hypothetical protein